MTAAFLGGILLAVVTLLGLVVWSIRRHRDPDLHIECDSPIDELIPTLAGLTLGTAVAGNTAKVLENGAFFDVLIDRIHAARESVHFETFLWKEGTLGRRVADASVENPALNIHGHDGGGGGRPKLDLRAADGGVIIDGELETVVGSGGSAQKFS